MDWNEVGNMLVFTSYSLPEDQPATLRIFSMNDDHPERFFLAHERSISSVRWSPDGELLATASLDGTINIWDADSFEILAVIETDDILTSLSWQPNSSNLVGAEWDGTIRIWDIPPND
jgi:WD40 repeat protein